MSTGAHAACTHRRHVTHLLCIVIVHRCELLEFSLLRCRSFFLLRPLLLAYIEVGLWLEFDHPGAEVILVTVRDIVHLERMALSAR